MPLSLDLTAIQGGAPQDAADVTAALLEIQAYVNSLSGDVHAPGDLKAIARNARRGLVAVRRGRGQPVDLRGAVLRDRHDLRCRRRGDDVRHPRRPRPCDCDAGRRGGAAVGQRRARPVRRRGEARADGRRARRARSPSRPA